MTVLSIQPSFRCNFKCPYCYLGSLRTEPQILDLALLEQRLQELTSNTYIECVDVFGGEIGLLPMDYLRELLKLLNKYLVQGQAINLTTNFSNLKILKLVKEFEGTCNVGLGLSYNFERQNFEAIDLYLRTGKDFPKRLCTLIVVLPSIIKYNIFALLNLCQAWYKNSGTEISFIRYFPSIYNNKDYEVSNQLYADYMKALLFTYNKANYSFPLNNIQQLANPGDPSLNSNIFIQPNGNYAWIQYDGNREYFKESYNFKDYQAATLKEQEQYQQHCILCSYYNKCLAEHLNFNSLKDIECCGLKGLLTWRDQGGLYGKDLC